MNFLVQSVASDINLLGAIDMKFTGGKSYEDIIAAGGSWNELRSDTPRSGVPTGEVSLQLAAANIC